jgi:hypothetical protein
VTTPIALLAAACPRCSADHMLGGKLLARMSDLGVRRFALGMMLLFGIIGLVLQAPLI